MLSLGPLGILTRRDPGSEFTLGSLELLDHAILKAYSEGTLAAYQRTAPDRETWYFIIPGGKNGTQKA